MPPKFFCLTFGVHVSIGQPHLTNIIINMKRIILVILLIIVLIPFLWLVLWSAITWSYEFKADLPSGEKEEVYCYIPEAELYFKIEGSTLRISRDLKALKSNQGNSTDLQLMNKQYPSTIFYPLEQSKKLVFISDPHNCLRLLRNTESVVWISEKQTGLVLPKSVEIILPKSSAYLYYRLSDGSCHKAELIDKETIKKIQAKSDTCRGDYSPLDLLPEDFLSETIDDANIHVVNHGAITLHLRDNWIVCGKNRIFPCFIYNPQYPHYLFCSEDSSCVLFKKCEDLQLIESQITKEDIKNSGMKNWYIIHLDPFMIEELD